MLIRVYNQNGKVKVTKVCGYRELTMFSSLPDGEMAEIEVSVTQYTKGGKKRIGDPAPVDTNEEVYGPPVPASIRRQKENAESFMATIRTLKFAAANQIIGKEEAEEAIKLLVGSAYGFMAQKDGENK